MIEGWVLAVILLFIVLIGVVIVFQMRILTTLEIIVRAIPLGAPKIQERRPPAEDTRTRPVGSTATGPRH